MSATESCFIEGCSLYKQRETSFHQFPYNEELRKNWCESIRVNNNQENAYEHHRNANVCGHHFHASEKYISGNNTLLQRNAIPTVFPRNSQNGVFVPESEPLSSTEIDSADNDLSETESVIILGQDDPLEEQNDFVAANSFAISDSEDFFGFEESDVNNEIVNASTGEIYVVFTEDEFKNVDNNTSSQIPSENPLEEVEDEVVFMENNVEVIEIDDDDDNELSCPIPEKAIEHTNMNVPTSPTKREPQKPVMNVKSGQQYPWYAIQQLVINNHPDVELRKTKLDWKSDQFRLIYIKGENQNVHTCTKCWELFYDINVDTIVRHTRCRPVPRVPRGAKRKMFKDSHKDTKLQEDKPATVQNVVMSKIQTLASCMDVQPSTFYQSKRFLQFAQFLIDTGAKIASSTINKSEFAYEPNQNVLCSFKDQLKDNQLTKISAILNTPNSDYSLSCEVWEDCCRGMSNVALELHYLDTNFRPHKIVIGVRSIVGTTVDNAAICDKILDILRIYSKKNNGTEFLENSIAFVTSRKLYSQSLGVVSFPSACSVINCIADAIVNEPKLKLAEQCLDVIEWLNGVSMERITTFDARHWKNIYELFQKMIGKRNCFAQRQVETDFKQDDSIMEILEPFYHAILKLSGPGNNITKVFAVFKTLERSLMPLETDEELIKAIKTKALEHLRIAFSKSDTYQISMFLDLTNRDQYNSLQSEEIDSLQSKIDSMINPYASTVENGCVENNLLDYMDDNVTSQKNQVDQFLQLSMPKEEDPYEFWRHNKQMTGLKAIARKYLTIPTYASLSECIRTESIKEFLGKRSKLEVKDLETVLMMNSYQSELHKPKNWNILQLNKC